MLGKERRELRARVIGEEGRIARLDLLHEVALDQTQNISFIAKLVVGNERHLCSRSRCVVVARRR